MEVARNTFENIYKQHANAIFGYFAVRLSDREKAKELTQEVFTNVWKYLADGKTIEYEKAFVYRAAHNAFVNEIRNKKETQSLDRLQEGGIDFEDKAETGASRRQEHYELLSKLDTLKQSYREVLLLRYFEDLQVKEIAEMLGESETNISMRIKRAEQSLKNLLI